MINELNPIPEINIDKLTSYDVDLDHLELGTGIYSRDYELAQLKISLSVANKVIELYRQNYDGVDIVSKKDAAKRLGVSYPTLDSWERLGLRRLQSPYESSKKVFYLWSDILAFLAVR